MTSKLLVLALMLAGIAWYVSVTYYPAQQAAAGGWLMRHE